MTWRAPAPWRKSSSEARSLDLLGPMALDEQIDHALGFARAFEQVRAADHRPPVAGWTWDREADFPGWCWPSTGPRAPGVLLDAAERRTTFLSGAVLELGWAGRVRVIRARAEDAAARTSELRAGFDVVWARSFGSPAVTAECAAPFLRPGGLLVVSEPPGPGQTVARWPREGLARARPGTCDDDPGSVRIPGHPPGEPRARTAFPVGREWPPNGPCTACPRGSQNNVALWPRSRQPRSGYRNRECSTCNFTVKHPLDSVTTAPGVPRVT